VTIPGDNVSIPPETYSREYLLSASTEGYEEFLAGGLSQVKARQLALLELRPELDLLEVGFGRGEFLRHCAALCRSVSGIDYSPAALEIAQRTLTGLANASAQIGDCRALPFAAATFDRVYSGDVIEHVSRRDGERMLAEAWRVLRPGGLLFIHTSPNAVFMNWTYPAARWLLKLIHAESVRRLDHHLATGHDVHVHEYNLFTLRAAARAAGLPQAEAWIDADLLRSGTSLHTRELQANPLVRAIGALGRLAPVRFLLGNDLYLRCRKPAATG
jgi:ubiquinone/menaquinone biosynthesis C-methylase UbiE